MMPVEEAATPIPDDAEAGETRHVIQERDERPCIFRYITAVVRTWGLLTAVAIWACTVVLLKDYKKYVYTPWYLLFMTLVFTFFELVWVLNKSACCRDDGGCCCKCWRFILWVDNWKKFILYSLIAIPCFLKGIAIHLAVISGLLVIVSGIFYLLKTIKNSDCIEKKRRVRQLVETTSPKANLVENEVQSATDRPTGYGSTDGETSPVQPTTDVLDRPEATAVTDGASEKSSSAVPSEGATQSETASKPQTKAETLESQ